MPIYKILLLIGYIPLIILFYKAFSTDEVTLIKGSISNYQIKNKKVFNKYMYIGAAFSLPGFVLWTMQTEYQSLPYLVTASLGWGLYKMTKYTLEESYFAHKYGAYLWFFSLSFLIIMLTGNGFFTIAVLIGLIIFVIFSLFKIGFSLPVLYLLSVFLVAVLFG